MSEENNYLVSYSGGKTSSYMSKLIKENWSDRNIHFVFANTGQENEKTYEFVEKVDKEFDLGVTWVEAVVNPELGKGIRHKVVNFETASRDGRPFEDFIAKHGIPNKALPQCTWRLKVEPIASYMKEVLKGEKYTTCIGIRKDETRRVSKGATKNRIAYPLVDVWPTDKWEINDFWEEMPFNLEIQEHQGNCSWCWKKSNKKLIRLIQESPEIFDFPRKMEEKYRYFRAEADRGRVFFRGERSTDDLFKMAEFMTATPLFDNLDDEDSGCSESCELYDMEE